MTKYVMVELKTTTYIKMPVEEFEKMNIETVNIEVIETDGTIHINRVDHSEFRECDSDEDDYEDDNEED